MFRKTTPFILILFVALFASSTLQAQQYARPDQTLSLGTYELLGAATVHEALNEASPNDNDYIFTATPLDQAVVGLSPVTDPQSSASHIIRIRAWGEDRPNSTAEVRLYKDAGATQIAAFPFTIAARRAWADFAFTLSAAQADSITDYGDLRLGIIHDFEANREIRFSWAEFEVPELSAVAPTVINETVVSLLDTSAVLEGEVSDNGGADVTERGVVWDLATNPDPTVDTNLGKSFENPTSPGTGTFQRTASPLDPQTDYKYRMYATNVAGTSYSATGTFTTLQAVVAPTLDPTPTYASVTETTAVLGGTVTFDGNDPAVVRGVVWDTVSPPESGGTFVPMGTGAGTYSQLVSDLPAGTIIYFKAYATNSADTSYSGQDQFETLKDLPTLGAPTKANIAATSADLGGEVTDTGGGTVSACGVWWHTSSPPESGGTQVPMSPCDAPFSQNVTGLPGGQVVYYRAYATNEVGTSFSTIDQFTPGEPPTLDPTPTVANVTHQSADLGGDITSSGGLPLTERGTVWAVAPTIPGIDDNRLAEGGTAVGAFSHTRTGLPAGTAINFRAYAINALGTTLTNDAQFTTGTQPTVQASNITFAGTSAKGMRIRWTRGNGEGSIVVIRTTGTTRADPVDGATYAANHIFPDAQEIPSGTQNFVVYAGANWYVDVGQMTPNTSYTVAVYEYTSSSGSWDYLQASPAEAVNSTTDQPVHNTDVGAECGDCHNAHNTAFLPRDTEQKAVCETCHNATGTAKAKLEFDLHLTPNKNPDLTYVDCGFCHELHNPDANNTTFSYNSLTLLSDYNKAYLRANVDKYVPTATTDDAFLHNDTYDAANAANAVTPERAVEGGDDVTARGYCQVCHTYTKYHRSSFTTVADRPNPGDPVPDQCHNGSSGNCGPDETHCAVCHQHNNKFIGVGGDQTCLDCHSSAQGSRPVITSQFNRLSTHVPGTLSELDCEVCHDGAHSSMVTVKNADTGEVYTHTGDNEVYEPHCLSCHADGVASKLPSSGSDQTSGSPFTGSGAPPIIDAATWTAASHNRDSGAFPSSPVTCVGNGANGCHSSGHGSEKLDLLGPDPQTPATAPAFSEQREGLCFNCHDSDGPASSDIKSLFPAAPGYRTTGAGGALVNQRHDVLYDDQQWSGGVVTCKDCHAPHADTASAPVSDPDDGLPLGTYSTANVYNDHGIGFPYRSAASDQDPVNPAGAVGGPYTEPDYIQFCLACHDGPGNAPPGVTMPESMVDIADDYRSRQHGNGEGSTGSRIGKGNLKPPWTTQAEYDAGNDPANVYAAINCNTCHGAHGTGNIFNLRESITVGGVQMSLGGQPGSEFESFNGQTTYTLPTINSGAQRQLEYGAWCTFCHNMSSHAGVDETTTCQSGHQHGNSAF